MNRSEIVEYLIENDNLDFVAHVMTPFHLLGLKAFLTNIYDKTKRKLSGVVLIGNNTKGGYILKPDEITSSDFYNIYPYYYKDERNSSKNILRKLLETFIKKGMSQERKKELYVIYPVETWTFFSIECLKKTKYKVIQVITDDGIGSYSSLIEWACTIMKDNENIKSGIYYFLRRMISKFFNGYYGIPVSYFTMFDKRNFWNQNVVGYYKDVFERQLDIIDVLIADKSVIYLSQPFSEEKNTKTAIDLLKRLSQKGYTIYIKRHPREEDNSLLDECGFEYLPQYYSIETIIYNSDIKPAMVIGWNSTALFTLAGFWNVNCYALCDLNKGNYNKHLMKKVNKIIRENEEKLPYLKSGEQLCNYCK